MEIKFKKEYDDKLEELGVKTKFISEFKKDCELRKESIKKGLIYLNKQPTFIDFFTGSFYFGNSDKEFWTNILNKLTKQDKDEHKQDKESGESNRGYPLGGSNDRG